MAQRSTKDLGAAWMSGQLSRRDFVHRLAASGVSLPTISAILAACGGSNGGTDGSGQAPSGNGDSGGDSQPSEGGRLIFGHNREPDSLDPHKVTAVIASDWMMKIYDTLVTLNPDLETIEPGLAEDWEISEDGKTYTFKLREGVTFHSGDLFTSEDVKYTITRWLNPDTGSPTKHRIAGIASVETPDEHTVVLKLEARNNELLFNLASGFAGILNHRFVGEKGADYGTLYVDGTGPFILENWSPRAEAIFKRNEAYTWGPPAYQNQGPAHVEELIFKIIPEDTTRMLELESGGVHIVPVIPPPDAANMEENADVQIIRGETGQTTYLGMNMRMEIVSDDHKPVRTAIQHAINKEQIVNDILHGYALVAWGPVAPFIKGALPDVEEFGYAYDPDKARAILDEAGWAPGADGIREKDGMRLTIPIYGIASDTNREMMGLFSSNLADVGIEMESVLIEEAAIWARLKAGEHTLMLMGMPHSTPDEILMFYFLSDNQPAPNRFGFSDPEVDEWLRDARKAATEEQWLEDYYNIQKRVLQEAFWMPLYHPYQIVGVRKEVAGFQYYGLYQMGSWKLLDVSLAE